MSVDFSLFDTTLFLTFFYVVVDSNVFVVKFYVCEMFSYCHIFNDVLI